MRLMLAVTIGIYVVLLVASNAHGKEAGIPIIKQTEIIEQCIAATDMQPACICMIKSFDKSLKELGLSYLDEIDPLTGQVIQQKAENECIEHFNTKQI